MSEKWYENIEEMVSHKRRFSSRLYDNTYVDEEDVHSLLHSHDNYGYSVNYHFLVDELTSIIEQLQGWDLLLKTQVKIVFATNTRYLTTQVQINRRNGPTWQNETKPQFFRLHFCFTLPWRIIYLIYSHQVSTTLYIIKQYQ